MAYEIQAIESVNGAKKLHHSALEKESEEGGQEMKAVLTNALIGLFFLAGIALAFSMQSATDRGREVYAEQKCALCHSIAGIGGKKSVLDGVGAKLRPEDIKRWIRTPREMKPNATMKPYPKLSEKDLEDLVGFLATLR